MGERVDEATDRAVHHGARYALIGAVVGGLAAGLVWAALLVLLATGLDDWADFIEGVGGHRMERGSVARGPPKTVRAEDLTRH